MVHFIGRIVFADFIHNASGTTMNMTYPKVLNTHLFSFLMVFNKICYGHKYAIINYHQEFGMWTKAICPIELQK
jgi:hypothetical protein